MTHLNETQSTEMAGIPVEICDPSSACAVAAQRAYRELRDRGVIDPEAFRAAVRVFRHHHPETSEQQAPFVVAGWIATDA